MQRQNDNKQSQTSRKATNQPLKIMQNAELITNTNAEYLGAISSNPFYFIIETEDAQEVYLKLEKGAKVTLQVVSKLEIKNFCTHNQTSSQMIKTNFLPLLESTPKASPNYRTNQEAARKIKGENKFSFKNLVIKFFNDTLFNSDPLQGAIKSLIYFFLFMLLALPFFANAQTYQAQPFRLWDRVACFLGKSPENLTLKEYREYVQTVCTLADSSQHTGKAAQNAATARKFENCDSARLQFASNIYQDSTEHLTSTNADSSTQHLPTDTAQSIQHLSAEDNQPTNDSTEHLTSTNDSSTQHLPTDTAQQTADSTQHLPTDSTEHLTSTNADSTQQEVEFLPLSEALQYYRAQGYSPKAARARVYQNIKQKGLKDNKTGNTIADSKTVDKFTKRIKDKKPALPIANKKKSSKPHYKRPAQRRKVKTLSYRVRKAKEAINLHFGICLK